MNNPPFKPGFFQTGGTCTLPTPVNCNFINAVDSRQNTVDLDLFPSPQARLNLQTYELRGSITASPNSGKPGDTITIQLQDFPDSPITSFNLSGTPIPITPAMTPVNGSANFFIEIPTGTPQGRLELQIANVVSGVRRTTINVSGALLTVSHREVIPNQKLTISGESFTASTTEVCIVEGGITLAGVPLQIDDVGECNAATLANAPNDPATGFTPERGIRISSEGTFTVAVRVEQTDGTIPIALATEGNFELRVVDTQGAQGTIRLTFPRRELSATPPVLRPGDIVTVNGRRFAALNPDGLTVSVDLLYRCGLVSALAMALPDQSGNFEVSLTVPNGCAIPSTNTITASLRATNRDVSTYTVVSDVITHDLANVPRAGGTVTLQFRSSTAGLATVEINGETFSASSTVADDGSWQIIGPPPGTYTISASAPGYLTAMAEILVGEGDIAMPTIELLGGDVNGDGIVNIDDVSGTASNFLQSGPREWEQQ
jgi:hypothetical protein